MIEFVINDKTIAIEKGFSMKVVRRSPFFVFSELPGDTGYDVDIPINESTSEVFGSPQVYERREAALIYKDTRIYKDGHLVIGGTLTITETTDSRYKGYIRGIVGDLGVDQRDKKLADHDFIGDVQFVNKKEYTPGTDHYACGEIINNDFFNDQGPQVEVHVPGDDNNYQDSRFGRDFYYTANYTVNKQTDTGVLAPSAEVNQDNPDVVATIAAVTPFLFIQYLVDRLLKENSFSIKENILSTDTNLSRLLLYNNSDIYITSFVKKEISVVVKSSYANCSYMKEIQEELRNVNTVNYKKLVPDTSLADLLLSIQNMFNVMFIFRDNRTVDIRDREATILSKPVDISKYFTGKWIKGEVKHQNIKFEWEPDSDDKTLSEHFQDLSDKESEFLPAVQTEDLLPQDAELGKYCEVISTGNIFQYKKQTDNVDAIGWELTSNNLQNYNYKRDDSTDTLEIKTSFTTVRIGNEGKAIAAQKGNFDTAPDDYSKFKPRVMFYRGNGVVSPKTDALEINWKGDIGLINKRWKLTAALMSNLQPVEGFFLFPDGILHSLDICSVFMTNDGAFLIDEMSYDLTDEPYSYVDIKGYKLEI